MVVSGEVYKSARALKPGLTQAAVARAAGIAPPNYSHIESGERNVGPELRSRLDPILALGERGSDDKPLVYVLACEPGLYTFYSDRHGRLAAFLDREIADAAAVFFRRLLGGEPTVAAAWPDFLGMMLAVDRTEPPPKFPGGGYVLDDGDPDKVREQVGQFMCEMVEAERQRAAQWQDVAEPVPADA